VRAAEGDILLEAAARALKQAAVFNEQSQRSSLFLGLLKPAQQRNDIVDKRVWLFGRASRVAFAIFFQLD
jgi:hypothetical protein